MRYAYEELVTKALSENATQDDINKLGKWFEQYGDTYWNGEVFTIDASHDLKPIYIEVAADEFELSHYEIV